MNIKNLKFGIIHSIVGKNDGVSIVIDQTVKAMIEYMGIPLGNIYFLAAYAPPRFNTSLDEIFWHKNEINRKIVKYFCEENPPRNFEKEINDNALYAKKTIKNWIEDNEIDFIMAHNTSHPYNFITAVGLGMLIEERREHEISWPKCLVWWHDSFFERPIFKNPSSVIKKYLKYIPGYRNDGIVFINSEQPKLAEKYFDSIDKQRTLNTGKYFRDRTAVIPNTCGISWDWEKYNWESDRLIAPPQEQYNKTFFRDIGLEAEVARKGLSIDNAVFLLQHTRVVPRKRIDKALDFAFRLENRFRQKKMDKFIVLLLSGHSGDEQVRYTEYLDEYHKKKCLENPDAEVMLIFGEKCILSSKDIIVDRKFYDFADIPAIIASKGGIGTYFSEIEGFGNNLLEMVSKGLPAVINSYNIYKSDIKHYGFKFPTVDRCEITDEVVDDAFRLLTEMKYRNETVKHNLEILDHNLTHHVIAKNLKKIISTVVILNSV